MQIKTNAIIPDKKDLEIEIHLDREEAELLKNCLQITKDNIVFETHTKVFAVKLLEKLLLVRNKEILSLINPL